MAGTLTWLGHAAFRMDTPGGKRVYVDPFLSGNPKCHESEVEPERVDLILLTHGHDDHVGDTIALYEKFKPRVIAPVELRWWLEAQGVEGASGNDPNKGGTVDADGISVTITDANHSSSIADRYMGEPTGLIVKLEDGYTLYFAGDTNVFGDMAIIRRLYEPRLAVLPIGDLFTMGPDDALEAVKLLKPRRVAPSHYNTWPPIAQDAAAWAERVRAETAAEPLVVTPGGVIPI